MSSRGEKPDTPALQLASFREVMATLKALPANPKPWWWVMALGTMGIMVAATAGSPLLLGKLIDALGDHSAFMRLLWIFIGFLLCEAFFRGVIVPWVMRDISQRYAVDLREAGLKSALQAPVPELLRLGTGAMITRLTRDVTRASDVFGIFGSRIMLLIFMIPATLVSLAFINPMYLIPGLLVSFLLVPWIKRLVPLSNYVADRESEADARRNARLLDSIRGISTVRAYGLEKWSLGRTRESSWQALQRSADKVTLLGLIYGESRIMHFLLIAGTMLISAWMLVNGQVSLGQITAALGLIAKLQFFLFDALHFAYNIQTGAVALSRAVALVRMGEKSQDLPIPADVTGPPEVEVRNLSFHYPNGVSVLDGLNLTLAAGTTTALVGTSGAGKSTLAALIAGLQHPTSGQVLVAGHDTATVSDVWTARQVTLLNQEVHLFAGTLREDLTMAAPEASDEELLAALAAAGLPTEGVLWQRWLPQGLDTLVGAQAQELSPEVMQIISLARVILRDPPVLVMDEATSEAGSDYARLLEQAATAAAQGRTSLVVAHRLDQAVMADRVLLMEDGQIIEDGPHEELIAMEGGRYAQLWAKWNQPLL